MPYYFPSFVLVLSRDLYTRRFFVENYNTIACVTAARRGWPVNYNQAFIVHEMYSDRVIYSEEMLVS